MSDKIRNAVATVLTNAANFPDRVQSRILGEDMGPLIDRVTEAVASVLAEQGEPEWEYAPSTEQVRSHYVFDQSDRWDPARGEAFDRWLESIRAEERERCAKVAETASAHAGTFIAGRIRALGNTEGSER